MAGVMHRSSGGVGSGRRRRSMNEINMVPFIDVMLVLLIIFMVSAPLITTGVVNLPSVGAANPRPQTVVEVTIKKDGSVEVSSTTAKKDLRKVAVTRLAQTARELQQGDPKVPVVISADRDVKYDSVIEAMANLREGGIERVGLSVKQQGK
jgi:biopolymer transport protein TolR